MWILGIHPSHEGLRIALAIPRDWVGFRVKRVFRAVTFDVVVKREGEGNNVSLVVEGKAVGVDVASLPSVKKSEVEVEVTLS